MNHSKWASPGVIAAAIAALVVLTGARAASAQHVTPAMAAAMLGTTGLEPPGCEDRARQAAATLDALNGNMERARRSDNDTEMRAAVDAGQKGFADLKARLGACRAGTPAPPPAPAAQSTAAAPAPAAAGAMAGMDHAKMDLAGAQPGGGGATTARQLTGPAEAALQSFEDALQIGNREVALQWLAPEATVTEAGATDGSREAYAKEHMGVDMAFLKTARTALLERQVHPGVDSTHIVSTSRVTGRAGEIPVNVTVTEQALLKRTPLGWRIVSLDWSIAAVPPASR